MFYLYLSISCASSWSFPAGLSVLVIQVPMVMLSLPRIFDGAPVAYLTYPSWWTVKGAVLVDPSGDWSDSVWLLHVIHCESRAKYNLTEPIPLQVEDVTVEFIVDPFRRPGPCLRTMKIYIQWCRVDTSYFNHKWYILIGRGGRLPSRTGPKDLPTAQYFSQFQDTTDAPLCHIHLPVCLWTMDPNSRASKKNTSHRNEVLPQDTTHLIQRLSPTWTSVPRSSRQSDHRKTSWQIVKRRKLQWCGHVFRLSGLVKTILQGTVKGARRRGRQRKRQHQGMDRPGVHQITEGSGGQGKMEETGCEIIRCVPTTLAVKE